MVQCIYWFAVPPERTCDRTKTWYQIWDVSSFASAVATRLQANFRLVTARWASVRVFQWLTVLFAWNGFCICHCFFTCLLIWKASVPAININMRLKQWRSQSSGDGDEIGHGRAPGWAGPLPKSENLSFFTHFIYGGIFLGFGCARSGLGWAFSGIRGTFRDLK